MAKRKISLEIEEASGVSEIDDKSACAFASIPIAEAQAGWDDIAVYPIKPTQGMALKKINFSGLPGSHFRVRSESLKGPLYHATIWEAVSRGIPKTVSLVGHEFGGHELSSVRLQIRTGHKGEATLEFDMYGE